MMNAKTARETVDGMKKGKLEKEINRVDKAICKAVEEGKENTMRNTMSDECKEYLIGLGYKVRYYGQGYAEDNGYIIEW